MILTLLISLIIAGGVYWCLPSKWLHNLAFPQQAAFFALIVCVCFLVPRMLLFSVRLFLGVIVLGVVYLIYLYFTNPTFAQGIQAWLNK